MPNSERPRVAASVVTASVCAFAIIATQVAGKATRDVLFLTNFPVSTLPTMLIASALLSIGAVLITARSMSRLGPFRVIPPFCVASGVLMLGEWFLATRDARLASVVVYLHVAVIGSILISGFWSIINEHFEPRSAKRSIGRIVGSATVGGLFGGLLAGRLGADVGVVWVLPIVAALHVLCGVLLPRLEPATGAVHSKRPERARNEREPASESGFRVLARVSYLRNLALVVVLCNVAATFIDYLFKARAAESFGESADLVRFFAVFYTVVSVFTLVVQTGMTRPLLEGIGIANTIAVRPAVMTIGGLATLPLMGLAGLGVLRALESVIQSSLFRSGYELLFTPVVPADKRSTKTIVDVGADRMGDILGGAIIRAVILLPVAVANYALIGLAVLASGLGFLIARALRRGYIRALEASLIHRADALEIERGPAVGMRTMMMESLSGIDLPTALDELRAADDSARGASPDPSQTTTAVGLATPMDPEVATLVALRSGDPARVHACLRDVRVLNPVLAAQVISLLAWDEVTAWASRALAKSAPSITGQLVDRMLDTHEDFAVRRRIPRILSTCTTERARDGLLAGLADKRFEVRYQSARALARIHDQSPSLPIAPVVVFAAVLREVSVDKSLWESQQLIDQPAEADATALLEDGLRARTNRSMEHVFTILSLALPRAPLQIAFKGLLTTDAVLRGTGLEYLESVLPREIWGALRPFLDDTRSTAPPPRSREAVLDDLMRSSQSIELNLEEIRKKIQES